MPSYELRIFKKGEDGEVGEECPRAKDLFNTSEEEEGEVCFRGRHIMSGYMANPKLGQEHVEEINELNRKAIDKNGWLHSGDKGAISETGMLKITSTSSSEAGARTSPLGPSRTTLSCSPLPSRTCTWWAIRGSTMCV